jgi:hypothetical protein
MLANLPNGGRVFVFALVTCDEIKDFLVTFAQSFAFSYHHHHFQPPADKTGTREHSSLICATNNTRTPVLCQGFK